MTEGATQAGGSGRGDGAPVTGTPTARKGVPASLAAAGRWMGDGRHQRGWEDYLAEFLAAILTWGGIGWLVDRWLGTAPGFLIGGIVLGNSLGIYLMWIRSNTDGAYIPSGDGRTIGENTDETSEPPA